MLTDPCGKHFSPLFFFLQGKLCRARAVHGGQTGFQQPAGSPPRGLLVDMEEVAGSGYGDTSLFFSFTLSALKCVVHAFRRGSHFFGGWGLCLFSCTFFVVVWLLRLPTPLPLITYAFLSLSTHDILAFHSFLAEDQLLFPFQMEPFVSASEQRSSVACPCLHHLQEWCLLSR